MSSVLPVKGLKAINLSDIVTAFVVESLGGVASQGLEASTRDRTKAIESS